MIDLYRPYHPLIFKKPTVLVGGCFDVLHVGHLRFLEEAKKIVGKKGYLIVALEPDRHIIHTKKRRPVHTEQERAYILSSLRFVDHVLLLSDLKTDEDYHQLVQDISPHFIAVTSNDPKLENKRRQAKFVGAVLKVVIDRLEGFSSSQILKRPKHLIKCYTNRVHEGLKIARTLGYPTANIHIDDASLKPGVYAGWVILQGNRYKAMCYFDVSRPKTLEAHLFNYHQDLYGQEITVILKTFIRSPEHFDSLDALKDRMKQDAQLCFIQGSGNKAWEHN